MVSGPPVSDRCFKAAAIFLKSVCKIICEIPSMLISAHKFSSLYGIRISLKAK